MQFVYILDDSSLDILSCSSKEDVVNFHNEIVDYLKDITGSNRNYKPFWSGFPEEVISKSECELWCHQIAHYLSNGTYIPNEWTQKRPTAFEHPKYTIISSGDEDRYLNILTNLLSVNQSLTPYDLEVVKHFVSSNEELRLPKTF
jgi:hypothetical protein